MMVYLVCDESGKAVSVWGWLDMAIARLRPGWTIKIERRRP